MGGIATLTYDSGGGGTGANAVDNIVPTAWEEIDYGFATGISDVGAVSAAKGVVNLTVKAPTAGTGFSLSYAGRMGGGHTSDGATDGGGGAGYKGVDLVLDFVDYDAAHMGFRWGVAAQTEILGNTCKRERNNREYGDLTSCNGPKHNPYAGSMFSKLQLGPLHFGTQATFKNLATGGASEIMNQRSIVGGIAAVFGNTLSLSYGVAYDKYRYNDRNRGYTYTGEGVCMQTVSSNSHCGGPEDHEYSTQKYRGWSGALNLGPVALKGTHNKVKGSEPTALYVHDTTHTEFNLSIAF